LFALFFDNVGGAGHVARMREKRNEYRISVGEPEKKETTGKTMT
jgi:hypothetical protein